MRIVKPGEPCPCCGAPIREAHGPGCLAVVSAKTARRKERRISDDVLRQICAGGAPKMPIQNWRSIAKALDVLERKGS